MPMMAEDSDSSGLSEHSDKEIQKLAPIFIKAKKATKLAAPPPVISPPRPKRPPSPPHEEVLADNPDIAFIVMFRSRFNDALPSKLPHYGPQDVERGVMEGPPSQQVEQLLCALLALVLNRKKPVERGHHGRALEEAVLSQKSQWPYKWNGQNPLHGGKGFENMTPAERLNLLRTLIMWSLTASEAVQAMIKDKYKQNRHNDDQNQPLSVISWGADGDKRNYYLVEGQDDTSFRIYREGSRSTKNATWWAVAGDIEEVRALSKKLEEVDRSQAARRLAAKMINAIPRFEGSEEKRRRREYRQVRRAAFTRPEPGFSLYEGRTRGKRMRYTYDDDDAFLSDATSTRRSTRQSARNTPFESGPTYTASGRQVKQPRTGDYGESLLSGAPASTDELVPEYTDGEDATSRARTGSEDSDPPVRGAGGRATRSGGRQPAVNGAVNPRKRKHIDGYNEIDAMSDEEDAGQSEDAWDSDKNDGEDDNNNNNNNNNVPDADDEDVEMSEDGSEADDEDDEPSSLVVKLKVPARALTPRSAPGTPNVVDDATQPGAVKSEAFETTNHRVPAPAQAVEASQVQQPSSSPAAPSGYPTPTSSSFQQVSEQKSVLAAPPSMPQFRHYNGSSFSAVKNGAESAGLPTKAAGLTSPPYVSRSSAAPTMNGMQHGPSGYPTQS